MLNIVGKTVKIPGYDILELVGIIASVDPVKKTGVFVGYLNLPNTKVDEIKRFSLDFNGGTYATAEQYKKDLSTGKVKVNPQQIKNSRMPKELGDAVRSKVNNLKKLSGRYDTRITVDLDKQKQFKETIAKKFKLAVQNDPDLGSEEYSLGLEFLNTKGFYFIKKNEVDKKGRHHLERLSTKAIRNIAVFSQDVVGGSRSDYYSSALLSGFEDFYLYIDCGEVDVMNLVRDQIRKSATYPNNVIKNISTIRKRYSEIKVNKVTK